MSGARNFATYVDANYVAYSSMSISSVLATQTLDRLWVFHDREPGSGEVDPLVCELVSRYRRRDRRVTGVCVDDAGLLPPGTSLLRGPHPQLYTDMLRARLYSYIREPLLWFDGDMLMVGDVSGLFALSDRATVAAAPDMAANGNGPTPGLYLAFADYVNARRGAGTIALDAPVNCGLLLLCADTSRRLNEGLTYALEFLEGPGEAAASRAASDSRATRRILRAILGQLAWNFVFHTSPAAVALCRCHNWLPAAPPVHTGALVPASVLVLHYLGDAKIHRMALDYTGLFGPGGVVRQRPDGPRPAAHTCPTTAGSAP